MTHTHTHTHTHIMLASRLPDFQYLNLKLLNSPDDLYPEFDLYLLAKLLDRSLFTRRHVDVSITKGSRDHCEGDCSGKNHDNLAS